MGKYVNGINGSFTGKVGNIIGSSWRGIPYMKSRSYRTKPATEGEKINRFIFGMTQKWLFPLKEFLRIGFNNYTLTNQGVNAAKSFLYKNALIKNGFDSLIDPTLAKVSHGDLPLPARIDVELNSDNKLIFIWDPTCNTENDLDQVMLLAYDIERRNAAMKTLGQFRETGRDELSVSNLNNFVVYAAFVSADRSTQSDSVYLGSFTAFETQKLEDKTGSESKAKTKDKSANSTEKASSTSSEEASETEEVPKNQLNLFEPLDEVTDNHAESVKNKTRSDETIMSSQSSQTEMNNSLMIASSPLRTTECNELINTNKNKHLLINYSNEKSGNNEMVSNETAKENPDPLKTQEAINQAESNKNLSGNDKNSETRTAGQPLTEELARNPILNDTHTSINQAELHKHNNDADSDTYSPVDQDTSAKIHPNKQADKELHTGVDQLLIDEESENKSLLNESEKAENQAEPDKNIPNNENHSDTQTSVNQNTADKNIRNHEKHSDTKASVDLSLKDENLPNNVALSEPKAEPKQEIPDKPSLTKSKEPEKQKYTYINPNIEIKNETMESPDSKKEEPDEKVVIKDGKVTYIMSKKYFDKTRHKRRS